MPKARVLLADNKAAFLKDWSEWLQRRSYQVTPASSVAEAKEVLKNGEVDLAILDLRLTDESEGDVSGLTLAQEHYGQLPIIILTAEPNKETLLWAVQHSKPGAFISVVEKIQNPEVLLQEMRKAFPPRVFVSHGHDDAAKAELVGFLEDRGLQPVILGDQPRSSQPLLAQFAKFADVEFAVVLVTPDDTGSRKGHPPQPRARQNVIFELGFLLGNLGSDRVVALCKEDEDDDKKIEWPSNYQGILYRTMDHSGGWQRLLAKDMKAAGVDLN